MKTVVWAVGKKEENWRDCGEDERLNQMLLRVKSYHNETHYHVELIYTDKIFSKLALKSQEKAYPAERGTARGYNTISCLESKFLGEKRLKW